MFPVSEYCLCLEALWRTSIQVGEHIEDADDGQDAAIKLGCH